MKALVCLVVLVIALLASACGPALPPATMTPTSQPTAQTTPNAKATENAIISHVFATLTASAPTATRAPILPPTAEPKAAATATRPRAGVVAPTVPPAPPAPTAAPKATVDPYLAQIPKGKGGILIVNYVGNREAVFTIAPNAYTVDPNGTKLIVIEPGTYNFSVQVPGLANGSWTDKITVVADQYVKYSVTVPQ